jgi:iron complex transport system substrate-binding protein
MIASIHRSRGARLRTGAVVAVAMTSVLLASCSEGTSAPAATGGTGTTETSAGPWTFTDDRGETVTLDEAPTTIVAQTENALPALLNMGVPVAGAFGSAPIAGNPALEGLDTTGIESLGEVYGEINLEQMAVMQPDLIVTTHEPGFLDGFNDEKQAERTAQIAPIVAIEKSVPSTEALDRWVELGAALGADLESDELTAARERYEAAWSAFEAAAASTDVTVAFVSTDSDGMYVAGPPLWGDLLDWQSAGLNVVEPDETEEFAGYWELLSWENPDKYAVDVLLWDNRPYSYLLPPDELDLPPTWDKLPAVQAGQVGPWAAGTNTSWQAYAEHLEALTALIESSEKVT